MPLHKSPHHCLLKAKIRCSSHQCPDEVLDQEKSCTPVLRDANNKNSKQPPQRATKNSPLSLQSYNFTGKYVIEVGLQLPAILFSGTPNMTQTVHIKTQGFDMKMYGYKYQVSQYWGCHKQTERSVRGPTWGLLVVLMWGST